MVQNLLKSEVFLAFLHSNIRRFWGFFRNYTNLGRQNSAKKAEILANICKFPHIHMFLFIWGHMSYFLWFRDLWAQSALILDAFNQKCNLFEVFLSYSIYRQGKPHNTENQQKTKKPEKLLFNENRACLLSLIAHIRSYELLFMVYRPLCATCINFRCI